MSLFDYHGRFAQSKKDSAPQDEEYLNALKSTSDDASEDDPGVASDNVEDESQLSEEAFVNDEDTATDVDSEVDGIEEAISLDESGEVEELTSIDESSEDDEEDAEEDVGEDEPSANAEDDSSSDEESSAETSEKSPDKSPDETAEKTDDLLDAASVQTNESDESDESDEASEEDSSEELEETSANDSKDSSEEKPSKKKKTPASKGKHAPGAQSSLDIDELSIAGKKSHRVLKGFGITACVIVILVAIIYGAGILVFTNRILPNTVVNSHDISMYTNEEAVQLLESIENNYSIEAKMGTFSYKITKAQIGLHFDAQQVVEAFHERYSAFDWPLYIFASNHDISNALNIEFDPSGYEEGFLAAVAEYNKTATPPTDAFIYFDENSKRYLIEDEIMGTQIDPERALAALNQAIRDLQPILRLTEAELVQPTMRANDEFIIESAKLANSLATSKFSLIVNDEVVRDIGNEELSKCIQINDKSEVTFNQDALAELCSLVAKEFNTIGAERTFTRADGKVITVKDGSYGWGVDEKALKDALLEAIMTGESATVVVPFETTAEIYTGPGQRDWGNRYIDVDLSEQHVRFYDENGTLFWETDCITGSPDGYHNTPQGVWYINENRESPSKLIGYENGKKIYESYVTYWMPFIKNSIGLHDATWQPGFGGSMYANGYGSHGCVNISYSAAQELWNIVREGDVVVTHF